MLPPTGNDVQQGKPALILFFNYLKEPNRSKQYLMGFLHRKRNKFEKRLRFHLFSNFSEFFYTNAWLCTLNCSKIWLGTFFIKKRDLTLYCDPETWLSIFQAMMNRHWERIAKITSHTFDVENENFQLRNIMEAPLLENKEDIEVCFCSVFFLIKDAKMY